MTYVNHDDQGLDLELLFLTKVLKLKSLHYGYWTESENLTLDGLRRAQQRYTDTLIELIPDGVSSVLDVGCGLGDISAVLAERGFKVTAISPDEHHRNYIESVWDGHFDFYHGPFESFNTRKKFDLVLMSESQNYFEPHTGFAQTISHLNKGGYLLVSGNFKRQVTDLFERVICIEEEYIEAAKQYGLELVDSIDITEFVLPQCHFENRIREEYLQPLLDIVQERLNSTMHWRLKLLKLFSRRNFQLLSDIYTDRVQRADPDTYEKHLKYVRLLFSYT